MSRAAAPGRVLLTTDAVGGVWTYTLDLSAGLAARGVQVTLATLGPPPSAAQRRQAADVPGLAVVDAGPTLDWIEDDPRALDRAGRRLGAIAEEAGVDLIHLNSPAFAAAGFGAPVVGTCHSCVATWWAAVRGGEPPAVFRARTARLAQGYAACRRLIAPSAAFAAATEVVYGVRPSVVPNGRAARPGAGPARKRPVAFAAGRLWDEAKGFAALDAAAGRMRGRVEAAGPLEGPNGAVAQARSVHALGPLDQAELAERLAGAAVFVSLSRYEPFGLGVLEAAQAGCALALADIPTFRELWDGAATFVDPDDPDAVAFQLDRFLDDHAAWAPAGERAARRAKRYGLDAMVEGTLAIYRQALAPTLEEAAA